MKKDLINKMFIFWGMPIVFVAAFLFLSISNKWFKFEQPKLLWYYGCVLLIVIVLELCYLLHLTHKRLNNGTNENKEIIEMLLTILGILFTVMNLYYYTLPTEYVIVVGIIFILLFTTKILKTNEYRNLANISLCVVFIILLLVQIYPNFNYTRYYQKTFEAIDDANKQDYYTAIRKMDNLLTDRYFANNYGNDLFPLAVNERERIVAMKENENAKHISVSISSPTIQKDSVVYIVTLSENAKNATLNENDIFKENFYSNTEIQKLDDNRYMIKLTNIKGSSGYKTIRVLSGVTETTYKKTSIITPESVSFLHINIYEVWYSIFISILFLLIPGIFILLYTKHQRNN